ncbi:DUF5047 domain-containing protein [Luteipulveratus sp. YIM 133132]|uniref:DUF5047 domain-containing protein n=1 Tax=Luteipulveratus flavus TaxID=3031728 RepID=UPI0023B1834F|nr:DUF5047 domain-containing protein [Luteipulveratus sp. YIM 133132]MDE9365962.1 DUF5047 domain-containing protein [Luteipulveratus sp. YIM 133132]
MIRGSAAFEAAITHTHRIAVSATAVMAGRDVATDLPIVGGQVSVDADKFVRRTASLEFVERLSPARRALQSLLERPGMRLQIDKGVAFPSGQAELLPVHHGLCDEVDASSGKGRITVESPDLGMLVSLDRFPSPTASTARSTVINQVRALVGHSVPFVDFRSTAVGAQVVPRVTWEKNRNDAVGALAVSIGCETFAAPDGGWLLRPTSSLWGTPVWTATEGASLIRLSRRTSWADVRNAWAVRAERSGGGSYYGYAEDTRPTSPTYVGGSFGRRVGFYSSPLLVSNAQCRMTAVSLLARQQGKRESVSFAAIGHPGLEAGDLVCVATQDQTLYLILDKFTVPLFKATIEDASARSMTPPDLEGMD